MKVLVRAFNKKEAFHEGSLTPLLLRFFGYNNEEEVKESELLESLGQEAVTAQVEQAEADMETEEEEEEGAGDDYR